MSFHPTRPPIARVLLGAFLVCQAAWGDSGHGEHSAGARLSLRVTVPEVLRVQANEHPAQWISNEAGEGRATQRLVVFSNLPGGVCVRLRLRDPSVRAWQLQPVQETATAWSAPGPDLREHCLHSAGTHVLELEHRFDGERFAAQRPWPVTTELQAF